jgi:indole-3-glycerol phosphate synthase
VSDFLASMAASSAARCAEAKSRVSERALRERVAGMTPVPALRLGVFSLIAEVKTASPSEGRIAGGDGGALGDSALVVEQARAYAAAGASAISVLTEPTKFGGSLEHLAACAAAVGGGLSGGVSGEIGTPCMRKDFVVEPYQVLEGRAFGAGGVLVIVRMLEDAVLRAMLEMADELGMFTVIEAFGEPDLARAGELLARVPARAGQARLVGINTRDLVTLKVEPDRLERLAGKFPPGCVRVAESGLATAEDAARVAALGYGAALVGTALMRAADPAGLAAAMLEAGRVGRAKCC